MRHFKTLSPWFKKINLFNRMHANKETNQPYGNLPTENGLFSSVMKTLSDRSLMDSWLEIFLSELIGTGLLMYMGCLGLFAAAGEWKTLPPMQGGVVWGFAVASIVVAFGHLSKAHLNPCVTLCAFLFGHISSPTLVVYILAEILGAILGMCALKISVPDKLYSMYNENAAPCGFCGTAIHSDLTIPQAFLLEFIATSLLIMVVCSIWDPRNEKINDSNPIKFALLIALISIAVGPFTGASMNPARSLAPAIVNNGWQDHWLYWVAPLSASAFTTLFYKFIFLKNMKPTESHHSGDADQNTAMLKTGTTSIIENESTVRVANHLV